MLLTRNKNMTIENICFFITIGFHLLTSICKNTNPHKGQLLRVDELLVYEGNHVPLSTRPKLSEYQAPDIS